MLWSGIDAWGIQILHWFYSLRSPFINQLSYYDITLGSSFFAIVLYGAIFASGKRKKAAYGFAGIIAVGLTVVGLKYLFHRPHPPNALMVFLVTYTFPSGHTASAFYSATYLRDKVNPVYLYGVASTVPIGLMILGAHWFLDTVFGAMIGVLFGLYVYKKEKSGNRIAP